MFIGDKGKIRIGNNTVDSNPTDLARFPQEQLKRRVPVSDNHIQNWFDAIKTRERPIADVEIGHRSVSVCHLANICGHLKRKLNWDAVNEMFVDDPEANRLLDREERAPYRHI
mgnify:CR=1 FL=1